MLIFSKYDIQILVNDSIWMYAQNDKWIIDENNKNKKVGSFMYSGSLINANSSAAEAAN